MILNLERKIDKLNAACSKSSQYCIEGNFSGGNIDKIIVISFPGVAILHPMECFITSQCD